MPTFTLRTSYFNVKEYADATKFYGIEAHIVGCLMHSCIPQAVQHGFKEILGRDFGLEKITKQLDTGVILADPKILVIIECHDRDGLDPDRRHDVEECIASKLFTLLEGLSASAFDGKFGFWDGMPLIDVRLDPKPYSATVIDCRGKIMQQVPKRGESNGVV